jgi:hypothetical protein
LSAALPSAAPDGLQWANVGDDDAETIELEALKDERRNLEVRDGCALLLADLRRFEAYPDEMANPDLDRKHVPLALTPRINR